MARRKRRGPIRKRIGRVTLYSHHGSWWIYYRESGKPQRRKAADELAEAERVAAQVNAQLTSDSPSLFSFTPVSIPELRRRFLAHHDGVLKSSVATIRRYRAATQHLDDFACSGGTNPMAHGILPTEFATYLRRVEVSPNGHPHTAKRHLRDKGVQFILETCRAMYGYAAKQRHLPPYAGNPFGALPIDQLKIEDSKPISMFDEAAELAFFKAASAWALPIHFTLAKTGLRVGELTHLLIEDLDLRHRWLYVKNKHGLGWRIKTGTERQVPLLEEVTELLRSVIGDRQDGPVFLRPKYTVSGAERLNGSLASLEQICRERVRESHDVSRAGFLRIAKGVWRDAGAIKSDAVRLSYMRISRSIGRPDATCPKSWRHGFATLLQDANVDPLVRQVTLGHHTTGQGLGMTAHYTHTRPETQRKQIEEALRRWTASLEFIVRHVQGGAV